jgi:hypothetical protein
MNTAPDTQTPYTQHPRDRVIRALLLAPLMLLVHLIAVGAFMLFLVRTVPSYMDIPADFEVDLSSAAVTVITISNLTIGHWYLTMIAVIVLDGALLFALHFLPPALAFVKWLWFGLFLLAVFLAMGLAIRVLESASDPIQVLLR